MAERVQLKTSFQAGNKGGASRFPGHPDVMFVNNKDIVTSPEAWTPPAMLLAATESCLYLTMQMLAQKMHIEIKGYSSEAEGVLDSPDGKHTQFTEITIRPKVELVDEAQKDKLTSIYEKAEEYCYVARSLNCTVKVEA
jgi:uncharacterized OsmC-like protein